MAIKTAQQLVGTEWAFHGDLNNNYTDNRITAGAAVIAAREMQKATHRLNAILDRLDMLGREGLHLIVKDMARQIRAKKKRRLAARRARRAKLKVAA